MIFTPPNKGYFVELSEHAVLLARTSASVPPFTVEELIECAPGEATALTEALGRLQPKRTASGYLQATVGIYPPKRLVRRHSLDVKRVKEPAYFAEICTQQFRVEPDKYRIAILNSTDGGDYDATRATQKEALFCGLPSEDVETTQTALLEMGIYPQRLELSTVAVLGGVVDLLQRATAKMPTLVLEIGSDATHSYIVSANGVEASRLIPQGLEAMVPIVQKELGLKDEESAKKLFYSNTFDFTGMGPLLTKRLLKELQSSIGFYEVQTGQSVGQVLTTQLAPKLAWLDTAIANALSIASLKLDATEWLKAHQITLPENLARNAQDVRWFGMFALMGRHDAVHAAPAEEKK